MPRPARSRISPWIENLIQSYCLGQGISSAAGRLKAHVIGVGQMSQSQAQGTEGPTGLLFLSDEVVQIPALLTASAWEHLQEQEDRECFTSLVNTTVCIQDYQLQFHMAQEQTKCRFFLSVGELATTAAGPLKNNTPCCTSLPSVRLKICKTWRALLGQEDSQGSQCGFNLSDLLGEWQHDCLLAVLDDIREKLMVGKRSAAMSPQPSTSTFAPSVTITATSWDADRVRYKGLKPFSVQIKQLLIPENIQQQQRQPQVEGGTHREFSEDRNTCKQSENATPSVDDADWLITEPGALNIEKQTNESVPKEDSMPHEDMVVGMIDSDIRPLANPWDMFPPPCDTSSSSEASPEPNRVPETSRGAVFTRTQLSVHTSKESLPPSQSKGEHSFFPPFQKPAPSASNTTSTGSSSSSFPGPPHPSNPPFVEHSSPASQPNGLILNQESKTLEKDMEVTAESKSRKVKRKRSELTPELLSTLLEEEEAQNSRSPPSWLFDSQAGSGSDEGSTHQQGQTVKKQIPTVHSDGKPFSYSYQMSVCNLKDLSRFGVEESLLHWAVKYLLVPKQADNLPINTSVPTVSGGTEVTSV